MPTGTYPRQGIKRGPYRHIPIEDRFWKYAVRQDGCWGWAGARSKSGYGVIMGEDRKARFAHRLSWEMHHGQIPEGGHVLHRCDNPPCTNPEHLFLGDPTVNSADKVAKGRARQPGWRPPHTILTPDIVQEIRRRYVPRKTTFRQLAEEFGVSISTVQNAVHRASWRSVT